MGCNDDHCCQDCGDRLIHQQRRRMTESSSVLGQAFQKFVTRCCAFADVDGAIERTRNGIKLIRKVEWKNRGQKFEGPQEKLLRADAEMLEALKHQGFKFSDGSRLSRESGVFVAHGEITPDVTFSGPVTVTNMFSGESKTMTPAEFLIWLPSRSDERSRGPEWSWDQFINQQQRETLAIQGE